MIIAKYVFNKECVVLEEGDGIIMLSKFYDIVNKHDDGDYIISIDHRPEFSAVEYAHIKGKEPGFVLVLTDNVVNTSDLNKK